MNSRHRLEDGGPGSDGAEPERITCPASCDLDGNVTIYPERMEVTPVDQGLFAAVTDADTFVNDTCVTCGLHAALFICAGRFVGVCPSCVVRRIADLRERSGGGEPPWITVLEKEAAREAAEQAWEAEGLYTVVFDDVWKCARCGALIRPEEARHYHAPGQRTSPPYCEPCADELRAAAGGEQVAD